MKVFLMCNLPFFSKDLRKEENGEHERKVWFPLLLVLHMIREKYKNTVEGILPLPPRYSNGTRRRPLAYTYA